jgi:predicted transcriptional regulator
MDTISDRIRKIIEKYRITPYAFSKRMGVARPDGIYKILKEPTRRPRARTLELIKNAFPEINHSWLLTGKGEMLKSDENKRLNR